MILIRPVTALRASLLTTASVGTLLWAAPAAAQCVVTDPMGGPLGDGATVTCADNLDTEGVIGPDFSDVTVDVEAPSGGISVTVAPGVVLGDGATITVAGASNRPIVTSGDDARAIDVADDATITVDGRAATSGENAIAIRTDRRADVTVSGVVTTGGGMSDAISLGDFSTLTLEDGANVNTQNSNSAAVNLRGNESTLNVNNGALVTTSSGMSNPVLVQGDDNSVEVGGDVRSSSGDATAILIEGDGAEITVIDGGFVTAQSSNSDAIAVTGSGATIRVEAGGEVSISSGNSRGIVSGDMGEVTIVGTVQASSSDSQGILLNDRATLTIQAGGLIETSSSESQAVRVAEDATRAEITVERDGRIDAVGAQAVLDVGDTDTRIVIDGTVFGGSSEPVLDLRAGDDVVIVNGTVRATSADPVIDMGAGDDETTINSSTTVEGPGVLVAGGDGDDTLNLNSGQEFDSSDFTGIETTNTGRNTTAGDPNEGEVTTINVDNDQSNGTFNAGEGGRVNVENGGTAGNVSASSGGRVDVRSGGTAGVSEDSGDGGEINFASGSTAQVDGEATGQPQQQRVAGANFEDGTRVEVRNSGVLQGRALGDRIDIELPDDAFSAFGETATSRSLGAAFDAAFAAGNDTAAELITENPELLADRIAAEAGDRYPQTAAMAVLAAQDFARTLTDRGAYDFGGVNGTISSMGPLAGGLSGATGWADISYGSYDLNPSDGEAFDSDVRTITAGMERPFNYGALGSGTAGLALNFAEGDVSSNSGTADFETLSLGIYGSAISGPRRLAAALSYGRVETDVDGGDSGDGRLLTARIEGAYDLIGSYDDARMAAPYIALTHSNGNFDGGASGGALGATLSDGDISQTVATAGMRFGTVFSGGTATFDIGYDKVFGDDAVVFAGDFNGNGFEASAVTGADERVRVGLGASLAVSDNVDFDIRYDAYRSDAGDGQSISAGFSMTF